MRRILPAELGQPDQALVGEDADDGRAERQRVGADLGDAHGMAS